MRSLWSLSKKNEELMVQDREDGGFCASGVLICHLCIAIPYSGEERRIT
jgi:hypothetical protein